MPLITPVGLDLPLEYVTRAWYAEATNAAPIGVALSITAEIPENAAVWHLFSFDTRQTIGHGRDVVWLSVAGRNTPSVMARSIATDYRRHHFIQHLWLNLPAGTHTFEARRNPSGCLMENRMMALLLLKR